MAVYIDVITGFLESGKTTFIQEMVGQNGMMEYQKALLIVCEEGFTEYDKELLSEQEITMITVEELVGLDDNFFRNIRKDYDPDYIIMEFNGTWDIGSLLKLKLPFTYQFRNVLFISEAGKFRYYLENMTSLMQPQVLNSDIILFNRYQEDKQQKKELLKTVKNINRETKALFYEEASIGDILSRFFPYHARSYTISWGTKIVTLLFITALFMSNRMLINSLGIIQSMSTIFLSILIEAIPFILFGAIVSSVIQLLVPTEWIIEKFSKRKIASFFIASVAGFFMPICDCGTAPIVSGLLKKGTPFPQTMTFWLASSAVNPVVLLSVYYAFPEQPMLVPLRMLSGMIIAVITGMLFRVCHIETQEVRQEVRAAQFIGSEILDMNNRGRFGKLMAVIKGARLEFFRVLKYLIIGAFISSFLQTILSQAVKGVLSGSFAVQLVVMLAAAVFMSTCSNSNAFIGRSFLSSFHIMPVMLYMVLGPMLDFKNMLMLSEAVKKRYLFITAAIVGLIGYIMFFALVRYVGIFPI